MANISTQLADLAIIRALTLERVKNGLSSNVAYAYNEIIDDIYSTIRGADDITLKNMNITIAELMDRVNPDLEFLDSEFKDLAKIEASYTIASSNAVIGADIFSKIPPDKALENIFKTTFIEGALIAESFKDVDSRIKKALEKQMRIGVTTGENNYTLAKRIRDNIFPNKTKADVMTIARTGAATVSNKARQLTYEANDDVIKGWQYLATLDKRTSDFCKAYSHKQWDMDKKPIKHKLPYREPPYQTHWNCLTGDTLISTRYPISYISRRSYEGVLYTIKTSRGNTLTCTPNHPILTNRGFIKVQLINDSDKIITDRISKGVRVSDVQNSEGVSTIENLFTSLSKSIGVRAVTMPTTTEDFHGDCTDNKVDVIYIDRKLCFKGNSFFSKNISKSSFIMTNFFIPIVSIFNKTRMRGLVSFHNIVTSLNLKFSLFNSLKRPLNSFLFRLTSKINALSLELGFQANYINIKSISNPPKSDSVIIESDSTLQDENTMIPLTKVNRDSVLLNDDSLDDFMSDAELSGNISNGSLGDKVLLDDIVSISISEKVLTHVYNLENDLNYYTANNLITHNCRSQILPTLKTFREMGIDMNEIPKGTQSSLDGQVSANMSFNDWLKTKDKKFIEKTLGKGRADLFLKGKITMSDLISQQGQTLTMTELKALSKVPEPTIPKVVKPKVKIPTIDLGYKGRYNHNFVDISDDAKLVVNKMSKPSKITTGAGGFVYQENRIIIPKDGKLTALHEYGHHLDHSLMSKEGVFLSTTRLKKASDLDLQHLGLEFGSKSKPIKLQAFEDDFMEQISYVVEKGKWKGAKAKKWVAKDEYKERWSGLVDNITDGYFRDKYNASGHGSKYFKSQTFYKQTENFADLFALWSDGSKWNETKKMFPNMTKEFESIMKEVLDD